MTHQSTLPGTARPPAAMATAACWLLKKYSASNIDLTLVSESKITLLISLEALWTYLQFDHGNQPTHSGIPMSGTVSACVLCACGGHDYNSTILKIGDVCVPLLLQHNLHQSLAGWNVSF